MFGHAGKIQSCLSAFRINEDLIQHTAVTDAIHWLVVNSRKLLGVVCNEITEKWNSGVVKGRILEQTIYFSVCRDRSKQIPASWDVTEIPLILKACNCLTVAKQSLRDRNRNKTLNKQLKIIFPFFFLNFNHQLL